jgi:hypothetical protein
MKSFKTGIPVTFLVASFNQVSNYLNAMNYMADLVAITPDEYGAQALFGGDTEWDPETDPALLNVPLTKLADLVSVEMFKVNRSQKALVYNPRIEDPVTVTGSEFGFDELFSKEPSLS